MILIELPTELLWQIISHLRLAREILHLSLACKKLHNVISKDGFRIFVQSRFPSMSIPVPIEYAGELNEFYKSAARSLTTSSKSWDRKAILAYQFLPLSNSKESRFGVRSPQTMGFIPCIDCYDNWFGGDWHDRNEVIACSTGAQFELCINNLSMSEDHGSTSNTPIRRSYDDKEKLDGRDDIVFVKLLHATSKAQEFLIGRSSMNFERIAYLYDRRKFSRTALFESGDKAVKTAAANSNGLLAACLSTHSIALYSTEVEEGTTVQPVQEVELVLPDNVQTRSARFLGQDRLAVAFGNPGTPMRIFDIGNGSLGQGEQVVEASRKSTLRRDNFASTDAESICSLEPLSPLNASGSREGDLFLAGYSDGSTGLYDLRCANPVVAVFKDNVDTSSIYSLMAYGHERFVAGAGRGSLLKFFDLRLPAKKYYAHELMPCSQPVMQNEIPSHTGSCCYFHHRMAHDKVGWNLFLRDGRDRYDSPVYSLSKTSDYSASFFAGIEGKIMKIDLGSIMDRFPDPVLGLHHSKSNNPEFNRREVRSWASRRKVLRLRMYEHVSRSSEAAKLRKQRPVDLYSGVYPGWDERWEPL